MLIHRLLDFCDSEYAGDSPTRCPGCVAACAGTCQACLDEIHFRRVIRDYNCQNMAHCYVCRYTSRYSSEIEYVVRGVTSLRDLPKWHIMSLGCGPSTDLFGFLCYLETTELNKEIVYVGVDRNEIWRPVHEEISRIVDGDPSIMVKYIYRDIFTIINRLRISEATWRPNILVLQYVVSDMVAKGQDMDDFTAQVAHQIIKRMASNSFVVMNDINHNTQARDYFEKMQRFLIAANLNIEVMRYYFQNRNAFFTYRYGIKHEDNDILTDIPEGYVAKYNPRDSCSSAQMVIRKVT